jgi:mono/diheme cytochrome c family protein
MAAMRNRYSFAIAVLALIFSAGVGRTVLTAQAEKTVWSGIYTTEQATRGKAKADAECGTCHGANMAGDLAPTLAGNDFIGHWYDAKLGELAAKITQTMPASAPGSLKADEYADVLAYLLQLNGFPAGMETLTVDPVTSLDAIKITKMQ